MSLPKPTIIGKATLYNCDCMELLKQTPDNFYELACVDPPYGVGMDGNNNWSGSKHEKKDWDNYTPVDDVSTQRQDLLPNEQEEVLDA